MKKLIALIAICFVMGAYGTLKAANPIVGVWYNVSDEGEHKGKPTSHIEIFENNGLYYAKIVKLLRDKPDVKCDKCVDDRKNQPIVGMQIVRGLKDDGDGLSGGKILDPANGKEYGCTMKLVGKNELRVRGWLAFIFRSQYWYRLK
jgi:uncharacterized protein (DUF2147 family)